ncbi:MAG: glycosyltransferase family 39 protein [bacterium]
MFKNSEKIILVLGIVLLSAVYFFARNAYYTGFFNDDAHYILAARSLTQGQYVELSQPEQPALTAYFPGYPIALAAVILLFGESIVLFKLMSILFSIGIVLTAYYYFRNKISKISLIYLLLFMALNPLQVSLSGTILSDVPFTFFGLLLILLNERWEAKTDYFSNIILGIIAGYLFLIRPLGLIFFAAVVVWCILNKYWKKLLILSISFIICVSPWVIRNMIINGVPTSYLTFFSETTALTHNVPLGAYLLGIVSKLFMYFRELYSFILFRWNFGPWDAIISLIISIGLTVITIFGYIKYFKNQLVISLLLLFYIGVIVLWPVYASRYLLPVVSFILFFLIKQLESWQLKFKLNIPLIHIICITGILLCLPPISSIIKASVSLNNVKSNPDIETYQWIRENIPEDSILIANNEAAINLLTSRYCRTMVRWENSTQMTQSLEKQGVEYVLVSDTSLFVRSALGNTVRDPLTFEELVMILEKSEMFKLVYCNNKEKMLIYKFS